MVLGLIRGRLKVDHREGAEVSCLRSVALASFPFSVTFAVYFTASSSLDYDK